jgi:SHAQKYF class myb-like DNA-binding protein
VSTFASTFSFPCSFSSLPLILLLLLLPPSFTFLLYCVEEHNRFLEAIKRCGGIAKVSPKKLWQELSVGHEHLTRKIVAAHLNTYRVSLKQLTPSTSQPEDTDTTASSQCLKDRSDVLRKAEEKKKGEGLFLEVVARLGGPKSCTPLMIYEEMNGIGAMNLRTVRRRLARLQKGKIEGTEEEEKKEEETETTVVGEKEEKAKGMIDNEEQTKETMEEEEAREKKETEWDTHLGSKEQNCEMKNL